MATKITVAVGANGEVLNALALRDGARADRLDSEATKKQARQAAIEKLDDDTNGRENKLNKGGIGRDPAAFARKKRDDVKGQFAGLNIQYLHFPLTEENAALKDGNYMRIKFRGIKTEEDGSGNKTSELSPEIVELRLVRNNNVAEFNIERPSGYKFSSDWDTRDEYGEMPLYMGFGGWPAYEGVDAYWQEGFNGRSISAHIINDDNYREYWIAVAFGSRWETFDDDRMDAVDNSSGITIWQDFPDYARLYSANEDVNGRRPVSSGGQLYVDRDYSPYTNSRYDPIEELFLLPYTEELFFAFVVYTDYNVGSYSGFTVNGTATSSSTDDKYPKLGMNSSFDGHTATAMETSYTRGKPVYQIPPGYEYRDYDLNALLPTGSAHPTITNTGANKIQQTYLYKIENGKVTAIPVPNELRAFAASLQTDLRNATVPLSGTNMKAQIAGYRQTVFYYEDQFLNPFIVRNAYKTDTNSCAAVQTRLAFIALKSEMIAGRKYLDHEQRARSLAKGYGFGRISTDNHFESSYIDTPLKSFFDDNYFTPMVYQYITGMGFPSMNYSQAALGLWIDPETDSTFTLSAYVDFDGYGKVRSTTGEGKPVRVDQSYQNDYTEWVDAPQLKNATHRCWNWNRPDMCWDKLRELGVPVSVLGTRPPKPDE